MPELPDLEVICEYLAPRLPGISVDSGRSCDPEKVRERALAPTGCLAKCPTDRLVREWLAQNLG